MQGVEDVRVLGIEEHLEGLIVVERKEALTATTRPTWMTGRNDDRATSRRGKEEKQHLEAAPKLGEPRDLICRQSAVEEGELVEHCVL